MIPADAPPPPCAGLSWLFDSREILHHKQAKAICDGCPILAECWDHLQVVKRAPKDRGGAPEGTWAGQLIGGIYKPRSVSCGTEGGNKRHRSNDEEPCDDCKVAAAEAARFRTERRRETA